MKLASRARRAMAVVVLGGCLLVGTGCDEHVAGQLATLSGGFLGDVITLVTTHYLQAALGVDATEGEAADEHEHEGGALHDHEH